MPSLVATMSALASTICVSTHYIRFKIIGKPLLGEKYVEGKKKERRRKKEEEE